MVAAVGVKGGFVFTFLLFLFHFTTHFVMNVRGGGPISLHGAVWSADGRHVLAPAGASVRVYAADSGSDAPVGLLRGHAADVTGVARHPVDDGKVSVCVCERD